MTGRPEGEGEAGWEVLESVVEYETGWYTGGYDLLEQPDGSRKRYYWAELPPAAVVVALDGEAVVFVEQHRPAVGETFLERRGGIVEDGETFAAAGRRELREETGYRAAEVTTLQTCWVATGVLRHRRGIVLARDLAAGPVEHDGNEFLGRRTVAADEALAAARGSPANDATLEGLLVAEADGYL